jgi:hypothetical protein
MFGASRSSASGQAHRRLVAAAALCLFALRSLVPIGFMLSMEAGHAAVTLCPDDAAGPTGHHAHHHPHSLHSGGSASADPESAGAHGHSLCPFAAAAHGGWQDVGVALTCAAPDSPKQFDRATNDVAVSRLHLWASHPARGPPALTLG